MRPGFAAGALLAAAACAPGPSGGDESPAMPDEPWTLEAPESRSGDGLRVLVIHDMEGLAGQSEPASFDFGTDLYPTGQEWLAADLNAVIDGLFAGGATEVWVADGHGSGNPEPDVRRDLLDPRARQVLRDEPFDTYFDLPESEDMDAVAVVGMHARTGSGGFASHTFTLGIEFLVNGRPITETELVALSWGRVGVPVIFASGDDRLAADLATMPWIEFVTVKEALAPDRARPRPVEEARADLRDAARRAVEDLGSARVMRVSTPVHAGLRAVPPASLALLEGVPGIDYRDGAVHFVADDMREAYDGLVALVGVATTGYSRGVLGEVLNARPDADALRAAFREALDRRWYDQEAGSYVPPEPPAPPDDARYHGYR